MSSMADLQAWQDRVSLSMWCGHQHSRGGVASRVVSRLYRGISTGLLEREGEAGQEEEEPTPISRTLSPVLRRKKMKKTEMVRAKLEMLLAAGPVEKHVECH